MAHLFRPSRPQTFIAVVAVFIAFATTASAHVKWFVDENTASIEGFRPYSLTDIEVLGWIAIALSLITLSIILDRELPTIRIAGTQTRHDFIEILRVFTGMSLLLTAYEGALIAPHLEAHGNLGTTLLFFEATTGIMLIANRFIRQAAVFMIILQFGVMIQFGLLPVVEYLIVTGIALFLLLNNIKSPELRDRYKPYSVAVLRIFTGISLLTLGISEKLTGAVLGQAFLQTYEWNFMAELGVSFFTDRLMVLSAGAVEVVFGIVLIIGTTTRLTVLAVSSLMLLSNITFLIQNENEAALVEFVGHMPIIAIALLLMLLGAGQRLKLTNLLPPRDHGRPMKTIRIPGEA